MAFAGKTWNDVHPMLWTHGHVQEWISDMVEKKRFPELICQSFMTILRNFDGKQLLDMTWEDRKRYLGGFYGELIWNELQDIQSCSGKKWTVLPVRQWTQKIVQEWITDEANQHDFPEALRRSVISELKYYDGPYLSIVSLATCTKQFGAVGEIIFEMLKPVVETVPGDEGRPELSYANIHRMRDSFAPGHDLKNMSGPSQLDIRRWTGRDVEGWINLVCAQRDIPLVHHLKFLSTLLQMSADTIANLTATDFNEMHSIYGIHLFEFLKKLREVAGKDQGEALAAGEDQGTAVAGDVPNVIRQCLASMQ